MKGPLKKDDWLRRNIQGAFDEQPKEHFAERLALALRRTPQHQNLLKKWKLWFISVGIIWVVLLMGLAYGIVRSGVLNQFKALSTINSWWLIAGLVALFLYFRSIITFVLLLLFKKFKNRSDENRTLTAG